LVVVVWCGVCVVGPVWEVDRNELEMLENIGGLVQ